MMAYAANADDSPEGPLSIREVYVFMPSRSKRQLMRGVFLHILCDNQNITTHYRKYITASSLSSYRRSYTYCKWSLLNDSSVAASSVTAASLPGTSSLPLIKRTNAVLRSSSLKANQTVEKIRSCCFSEGCARPAKCMVKKTRKRQVRSQG